MTSADEREPWELEGEGADSEAPAHPTNRPIKEDERGESSAAGSLYARLRMHATRSIPSRRRRRRGLSLASTRGIKHLRQGGECDRRCGTGIHENLPRVAHPTRNADAARRSPAAYLRLKAERVIGVGACRDRSA